MVLAHKLIVIPIAFEHLAVGGSEFAESVAHVVFPVAFIAVAVFPCIGAVSLGTAAVEVAAIDTATRVVVCAFAFTLSFLPVTEQVLPPLKNPPS